MGLGGRVANPDDDSVKQTFRADWGISIDAGVLKVVPMPAADVTTQILDLYQTKLRHPPLLAIWVVGYSGSMRGEGKRGVVDGLTQALDPAESAKSMVQSTDGDANVLIPFSSHVINAVVPTPTPPRPTPTTRAWTTSSPPRRRPSPTGRRRASRPGRATSSSTRPSSSIPTRMSPTRSWARAS
ncbi:hypothetical protein [uncultured Parolsenella sp.]|uniref:hypothetical protein n=1 Tax=uncultured Parolsenella sp. TaxID=2083008 RepID=UPI0027DC5F76|nr:hypothetical protein [uncultured Parolsenella sp.]